MAPLWIPKMISKHALFELNVTNTYQLKLCYPKCSQTHIIRFWVSKQVMSPHVFGWLLSVRCFLTIVPGFIASLENMIFISFIPFNPHMNHLWFNAICSIFSRDADARFISVTQQTMWVFWLLVSVSILSTAQDYEPAGVSGDDDENSEESMEDC